MFNVLTNVVIVSYGIIGLLIISPYVIRKLKKYKDDLNSDTKNMYIPTNGIIHKKENK